MVFETDSGVMEGKFGVLKRVDLRQLWPNEALDFTPWLAENLGVLGDALGMDLELQLQEAPVGPFSLDLLVNDVGRDRVVVIENQIEATNHDHLGKLLTYAAGHNASVAVWIASQFREEHRQALDWLNQRTDATTEFFGVVVEALQIDTSRPACNFRLVAFPNDWRKANVSKSAQSTSPRSEAYRAFFQDLIDRLREQYQFTKARKGQAQGWYSFASGLRGVTYGVSFAQGQRVRTEVYIDRPDPFWNKWTFDALLTERSKIETELGESLEWERLDEKRASRIATYRQGSIDDSEEGREEILVWAIDRLLRMRDVFGPRVSALALMGNHEAPQDGAM